MRVMFIFSREESTNAWDFIEFDVQLVLKAYVRRATAVKTQSLIRE